jgi:hypothetical protein
VAPEEEIAASSAGHVKASAFGLAAPATPTLRKAGAYQMAGSPCWLQPEQYLLSSHRKACVSQPELPRRDRRHKQIGEITSFRECLANLGSEVVSL